MELELPLPSTKADENDQIDGYEVISGLNEYSNDSEESDVEKCREEELDTSTATHNQCASEFYLGHSGSVENKENLFTAAPSDCIFSQNETKATALRLCDQVQIVDQQIQEVTKRIKEGRALKKEIRSIGLQQIASARAEVERIRSERQIEMM